MPDAAAFLINSPVSKQQIEVNEMEIILIDIRFTAIWFVSSAGIGELHAMLVDTPAQSHWMMTLRWLIKTSLITFRSVVTNQIAT